MSPRTWIRHLSAVLTLVVVASGAPSRASVQLSSKDTEPPNPRVIFHVENFRDVAGGAQMGSRAYLSACRSDDTCGVYRTDADGPLELVRNFSLPNSDRPRWLNIVGATEHRVLFSVLTPTGPQLWGTDGTASGSEHLLDTNIDDLRSFGGEVVFRTNMWDQATQWYRSDGTSDGTRPMPTTSSGDEDRATSMAPLDGLAVMVSNDAIVVSDGTPAGTRRVPVDLSSYELNVGGAWMGGAYYFLMGDSPVRGALPPNGRCDLWRTDGSPSGTRVVTSSTPYECNYSELVASGDHVYFQMYRDRGPDAAPQSALVASDGTAQGTFELSTATLPTSLRSEVGPPVVVDGVVEFPTSMEEQNSWWPPPGGYAAYDSTYVRLRLSSDGRSIVSGPVSLIHPLAGVKLGESQILTTYQYSNATAVSSYFGFRYDSSRPLLGQSSELGVDLDRTTVRRGKTLRGSVEMSSRILPSYNTPGALVVSAGKRVLLKKRLPFFLDYAPAFALPTKSLPRGKTQLTFTWTGDVRIQATAPVVRTVTVR